LEDTDTIVPFVLILNPIVVALGVCWLTMAVMVADGEMVSDCPSATSVAVAADERTPRIELNVCTTSKKFGDGGAGAISCHALLCDDDDETATELCNVMTKFVSTDKNESQF